MRSLSPEEAALWARVASTIRPLSRGRISQQPTESTVQSDVRRVVVPSPRRESPVPAAAPGAGTLDASWDRRLRSGALTPDRTVDLHGMTLDQAWRAIDTALDRAIANGERVVLLITGHERRGDPPIRRGAIRAAVHDWLVASRHSGGIAAVRGAHPRHGGGGSLYIVLRRKGRPVR